MSEEDAPPLDPTSPAAPRGSVCPCGAAAPVPLPPLGRRPVRCGDCGTPLVRRDDVRGTFDRALGAALVAGGLGAIGWAYAALATGTGAVWVLPVLGALVGGAAWLGARRRGATVQWAGVLGLLGAVTAGEILLYRVALLPRLLRLHEAEGARDAAANAQAELGSMSVGDYLHIELSLGLLLGLGVALAVVWWMGRAPRAVVAFEEPVGFAPGPAPGPEHGPPQAGAEVRPFTA